MVCAPFLPLIHGLCAFFRPLLTPVSTAPFFASLSVHGLRALEKLRLRRFWDILPVFEGMLSTFCLASCSQRKSKGQQLKGKIVSALFHTFSLFSTLSHAFSDCTSRFTRSRIPFILGRFQGAPQACTRFRANFGEAWRTLANPQAICMRTTLKGSLISGKKKAHKHKLFGPVALGTPRECPGDKPGLSPGQSGFVPGTNPGFLPRGHSGGEGRQKEFMR